MFRISVPVMASEGVETVFLTPVRKHLRITSYRRFPSRLKI